MLAHWPKPVDVQLHALGQSGDSKTALVRNAVPRCSHAMARPQFVLEHMHEAALIAIGEQIEVAAKVRPMIQRLYYGDFASCGFDPGANSLEVH